MKTQEIKELAKMDVTALKAKLADLHKGYVDAVKAGLRKDQKNLHVGYGIKKDIARVLTFIRQRELGL